MRRLLVTVLGCGAIAAGVATMCAQAKDPDPDAPPAIAAAPAAEAPAGKVVYTFESEDKMKEFEVLWRQRQVAAVRMTVLQSYWNEEQVTINQLNQELANNYQIDVKKGYSLDTNRKVLIERPEAVASPDASQASVAPGIPPAPTPN